MPSIGSYTKQRPLNNGYFRSITSNLAGDNAHMFTLSLASNGAFSSAAALGANPAGYIGLLRDLGTQYYDAATDRVFRRTQIVTSTASQTGAAGTTDDSYGVVYIIVGRLGAATGTAATLATPSVFVRTG
jgi:hypothetical protein